MATFLAVDSVKVDADSGGDFELLWGDQVEVLEAQGGRTHVRARGRTRKGWVPSSSLREGAPLLELYFIDVGQGDGILIRTPDDRHIMIDGGVRRSDQQTGKNAADFVDWKFFEDYGRNAIAIDALMASHCDADHYGGLWDLLNAKQSTELDATGVTVETFYHAGVSWWESPGGNRTLGPRAAGPGGQYLTRLLGDRAMAEACLPSGADPRLSGQWRQFLETVVAAKKQDGTPASIQRLDSTLGYVPGFAPANGPATLRVLGPIVEQVNGAAALPLLPGGDSQNTNGHSLLLRLDYGRVRVLLTGDLNLGSQRRILAQLTGFRQELQADVTKACHHGSDDVHLEFLRAIEGAATVISSGDGEGYDHPRPRAIAMTALSGHQKFGQDGELETPLVYSTELARSVTLQRAASGRPVLKNIVYGLVNVRTDGERILCATRNESDLTWNIATFQSRF